MTPAPWKAPNKKLIQAWLDLQCSMVQGVAHGAVLVGDGRTSAGDPVAVWPPGGMLTATMLTAAKRALIERRRVVEAMALAAGSDVGGSDVMALPLIVEGEVVGAVALDMTARMKAKQEASLQVLSWGTEWLALLVEHLNNGPNLRLNIVVETIAEAVKHDAFGAAAAAVASALSRLLDCARVSIGFKDFNEVVVALRSRIPPASSSVPISSARCPRRCMRRSIRTSASRRRRRAQMASPSRAPTISCKTSSAPRRSTRVRSRTTPNLVGAVTLERNADHVMSASDIALAETIASIVGPILFTKRYSQLPWPRRTGLALRDSLHRFTEPGHLTFKAGVLGVIVAFLAVAFVHIEHDVKADAMLKGRVQRAVTAPFDGYIAEATIRAGDMVAKDLVMAELEDRELKLERAKWSGERAQLVKERREALAKRDRAELSILRAKLDQAHANLALAEEKLARTRVTAPINGVVVSGDLSQSLGAPVKRSDLLYEAAPLDEYRVVLEVDERDISFVRLGQSGELSLSNMPYLTQTFTVDRIVPASEAEDGGNFFAVEAHLDGNVQHLRPGMAGVGKINAGERPLLWIWTHRITAWVRLSLWQWWG